MLQKENHFKPRYLILILLFLLFIFLFLGKNFLPKSLFFKKALQFNLFLAKPSFFLKNKIISLTNNIESYFKTKRELDYYNDILKEKNLELTVKLLKLKILERENNELLALLGRRPESDFLISSVLYRPPFSDFDTFIADAGLNQGVQKGMKVTAYGDIILGEVEEVFKNSSKVKLYSYYGTQINVFLKSFSLTRPDLAVTALGRGGENFEITLAKDIEVETGDKIITTDLQPFILGEVQKIIKNESEPFQKIYFRYPLNLNELRYVYIK